MRQAPRTMGYTLSAVLGPAAALGPPSPALHDLVALARGLALRPVDHAVLDEEGDLEEDRFFLLLPPVVAYLEEASRAARVLYVEAEFFGGVGDQGAAGWEHGARALAPVFSHHGGGRPTGRLLGTSSGAINEGLRWLGVRAGRAVDEFEAVGLDARRDWDPDED